jgi:CHAT domain-containing protein/Tfp pilus assembly protein PilF
MWHFQNSENATLRRVASLPVNSAAVETNKSARKTSDETIKSPLLDGSMGAQFEQRAEKRFPFKTMGHYVPVQVVWFLLLLQLTGAAYQLNARRPDSLASPLQSDAPVDAQGETVLETGEAIIRELSGGESHFYRVNLAPHQFLHLVADQRGIDVVLALYGPDRKRIAEADSPNGTHGPEPCWWVADAGGAYQLEVRALEADAPPGLYQVKIEERRAATVQDQDRIAAQSAFARGEQLFAAGTPESRGSSINDFEFAISRWRATGERQMEATALTRVGNVYDSLGEPRKALDYYNQALAIRRALGNQREEANTLTNIGLIYKTLGEPQKAFINYNRALLLRRAIKDSEGEAFTLHNIAAVYMLLGEPQKALDLYGQALWLRRAVADRSGEATTLDSLGTVYEGLGNPEKALNYYDQALTLARDVGNRREEARILNNIGLIYASSGDGRRAMGYYDQVLSLRRGMGDRLTEVHVLKNLGSLYKSTGEGRRALEYYERALSLVRAMGDRQGEASILNDIGDVYLMRGAGQQAFDCYRQALPLARAVQDRGGEAYTLLNLARAESLLGRLSEAFGYAEAALPIVESLRTKIASQELRATYFASVQPFFEFYINLLMRLHERHPKEGFEIAAFQASERARARSLIESLAESRVNIRQGIDHALLEQEQSLRRALNAKAEQQTRLLNGKHREDEAAVLKREIDDLLTQFQDVEAQIRSRSPHYAALTQPVPLSLNQIQRDLDTDMMLLEYALGEEHSYVWAITPDSIRSFQLPGRAEIEAQARRVYGLLTARNQLVRFETADERRARIAASDAGYLEAATVLARMVLGPVAPYLEKKQLLIVSEGALNYVPFAALPVPATGIATFRQGRSKEPDRPVLSADSENYVPLVVEHEIAYLPSASMLATLRSEPRRITSTVKKVAVIADPVFEKDDERVREGKVGKLTGASLSGRAAARERSRTFNDGLIQSARESGFGDEGLTISRLPYTRREADAILALASEADRKKALDFDASLLTATNPELGSYRFVHFATHGLLNSTHPELSGIVLSLVDSRGVEQDGFLRVNEVLNLKLPVELVVLSGCRTGLGKEIKGEGLVGLTRGFMYAGAARVIVSLWGVSDEASAELMIRLYQKMLGKEELRPAAALRAAQVAIWKEKRWQAPYYWSAFVLQGEPR